MKELIIISIVKTLVLISIYLILSFPISLLWNECLVSAIDGVHTITWYQAFGICIVYVLITSPATDTDVN